MTLAASIQGVNSRWLPQWKESIRAGGLNGRSQFALVASIQGVLETKKSTDFRQLVREAIETANNLPA